VDTLAAQTGLSIEMTNRLIAILDGIAPGLRAWSEQVKAAVKQGLREFRTYSGRVIHLDPRAPHKAPNYIIQGTARELLVDALIRWEQGPYAGGVVLPVHDEIVAMVPAEQAPAATAYLVACMTTQLGPVPIEVEADEPSEVWRSAA
jgi:DNA polymerase I-like protein with 3'-5' exonuclease and polymerase domains